MKKHHKALIHAIFWSIGATALFTGLALIFWKEAFTEDFSRYWPWFLGCLVFIFIFVLIYSYWLEHQKEQVEEKESVFVQKTTTNKKQQNTTPLLKSNSNKVKPKKKNSKQIT